MIVSGTGFRVRFLLAVAGDFVFGLLARVQVWCARARDGDLDQPSAGDAQLASRNPMFVFALPGELFAFAARTPAFAPLFQLPPTYNSAGFFIHLSPAAMRSSSHRAAALWIP